jgi:hypothetical protein
MITTLSFVKNVLPAGKIPAHINYSDLSGVGISIPFAVMGWDEGLDYNEDGTAYQDSPPCECVDGAFETREEAEANLLKAQQHDPKGRYWIVENHIEPLYAFSHVHWDGLDREGYIALLMSPEDVATLESRLVKEMVKTEYSEYEAVRLA